MIGLEVAPPASGLHSLSSRPQGLLESSVCVAGGGERASKQAGPQRNLKYFTVTTWLSADYSLPIRAGLTNMQYISCLSSSPVDLSRSRLIGCFGTAAFSSRSFPPAASLTGLKELWPTAGPQPKPLTDFISASWWCILFNFTSNSNDWPTFDHNLFRSCWDFSGSEALRLPQNH